jgi:D-alanyl-D-alanine dipeptidase
MRKLAYVVFAFLFLASCSGNSDKPASEKNGTLEKRKVKAVKPISFLERKCIASGLVDIGKFDSLIKVELKYSTKDNFMGYDMYGDFDKAYLQKDVAEKLVNAEKFLTKTKPGYSLIIYDAARPRSVQLKMWDTLKIPFSEKIKYVANPKTGGLHNYGAAIDLSIIDELGVPLDMGTAYDFMGDLASTVNEQKMLNEKKLTQLQLDNRKLLRSAMLSAGLYPIESEWWHFNSCSMEKAAVKYKIIE